MVGPEPQLSTRGSPHPEVSPAGHTFLTARPNQEKGGVRNSDKSKGLGATHQDSNPGPPQDFRVTWASQFPCL